MTRGDVRRVGALALWLVLAACGRTERPRPDTMPIQFEESPGALASRHEAQGSFDAARAALARKDFDECATHLAAAAAFVRARALRAEPDAQPALERAAEALETLVANVVRGRPRTRKDLDRVFAQAHAAEATEHLARTRVAVLKRDNVRAGEELLMSIDHLERAARDAGRRTDADVRAAVADARTLAGEMVKGMDAVPDEVRKVTSEIESAIRRIPASDYAPVTPWP